MQRRQIVLWVAISATILLAIGVLGVLNAMGPDREKIRAELEEKIEELNRIPAEEAVRKDAFAHELRDNVEYQTHARALWLKVEKSHARLHEAAELERTAQKEVTPFLARCKDLTVIPWAELRRMNDEARSLINSYGSTRYGAALRKAQTAIQARLEKEPKNGGVQGFMELTRKVHSIVAEGRFAEAMDLIAAYLKVPENWDNSIRARELSEFVQRKAVAGADTLMENVRALMSRGDKVGAAAAIDRGLPNFKGFKKEIDLLEAYRRTIR